MSALDLWRIIGEVTAERDAQTKRAERLERWYADALTMLDKSRRWKSIASLTAERDSLAARLALVEALAEAEVARLTAERDAAIERLERVIDQWRKTGRAVISEMNRAERAEAERDALAAQVARVESLAEEWSTELDENRCPAHAFPGCDCHEGYHHAWDDLRAALAGPTALDAMGADQ